MHKEKIHLQPAFDLQSAGQYLGKDHFKTIYN